MKHVTSFTFLSAGVLVAGAALLATRGGDGESRTRVERGRYIVEAFGCVDCHTPWRMGANGPEPDPDRMFQGHPEDLVMPPAPELEMPWAMAASATNTAWSGPWGVSFTANLTPDPETGIGNWTEAEFLATFRSRRHLGRGREILPPMPVDALRNLDDEDLASVFAYFKSLPPIRNKVPEPLPPAGAH